MNTALLEKHLELVIEANKTLNITRIASWEDGMLLHVKDSLLGLETLNKCPAGKLADIGSGAGYPGIPLAIEGGRDTVLVDSVGKKTRVLDGFIKQLGLKNVSTANQRIEDFGKQHQGEFAAVTARALSKLSVLLELAAPLLFVGGRLIAYKANVEADELNHANDVCAVAGMQLIDDKTYSLEGFNRRILCYEKTCEPKIKLPRRVGLAQKKPL